MRKAIDDGIVADECHEPRRAPHPIRVWCEDEEEADGEIVAFDPDADDPDALATDYAEKVYENGDPFRTLRVRVRMSDGSLRAYEVSVDYDPVFYALERFEKYEPREAERHRMADEAHDIAKVEGDPEKDDEKPI
jgi:hypothetical protein